MSVSVEDSHSKIARAKSFKIGKILIPYWLVAVILVSTIGSAVLGSYLTTVSIPLQVNEPLQILGYPSGWSLYPGQTAEFNVTVMNYAPLNYSVVLDFQMSDLTYQANYMTFSNDIYTVVPGQQNLTAWLYVAANAPAENLMVNITLARLPIVTPTSNYLVNGNFEEGTFDGWNVTGACEISNTIVHSGEYSAYISDIDSDNSIDQMLMLPADSNFQFTGWIYPTVVGQSSGYACSSSIFFFFCNKIDTTNLFSVEYMWCGYPLSNTTSHLAFDESSSFNAHTWNCLSCNLTNDILSYFQGIDLSQFVLHDVLVQYHYSNTSPGPFYADDLSLSITASS